MDVHVMQVIALCLPVAPVSIPAHGIVQGSVNGIATHRFFDTLNKVERKLNDGVKNQHATMQGR